jgi:glycosyltransferase involved in cell wall biosynthesis
MKVLHLLDSLNRGGAETLVLDLCRNARRNGLDISMAALSGGPLETEFESSGVATYRFKRRLPLDLGVIRGLRHLLIAQQIDVVHCHQAVEAVHARLAIPRKGKKTKVVQTFHLCSSDLKNRTALRWTTPRMSANICVSNQLRQCLAREAGFVTTGFRVIHNGIDAQRLQSNEDGSIKDEIGIGKHDKLLGMVGNFYADGRKDHLTVCRALPSVLARVERAHFVFVGKSVGPGKQMEECREYCADLDLSHRVHFLGPRNDIAKILASLNVFVFSSKHDSFGIAAVEAMMAGVPLVASDIGAIREVTNNGSYAKLFAVGDAISLTDRVIDALESRAHSVEAARRWALDQFGIDAHITRLKELYEAVTHP